MKYLKVFTDFIKTIGAFSDAECGRLFKAMLEYAGEGKEPEFRGNERFIWGTVQMNIDMQRESYDRICAQNKRIATERNVASRSVTERDVALQEKVKAKTKTKESKDEIKEEVIVIAPPPDFNPELQEAISEWIRYKNERKDKYTPTGWSNLMSQLRKEEKQYGTGAVCEVIRYSIMQGYQGILHDRLEDIRAKELKKKAEKPITTNPFYKMLIEEGGAV